MKNEIVKVNDVKIECPYYEEQHFVALKPVCQALGIAHAPQIRRLQLDGILGSVVTDIRVTTGGDGKQYEMVCIPLKFVFGWLFTIDEEKIKPESKGGFIKYKLECYNILYEKFVMESRFFKMKEEKESEILEEISEIENQLDTKKDELKKAKIKLETVKKYTYQEYKKNKNQLLLQFPD